MPAGQYQRPLRRFSCAYKRRQHIKDKFRELFADSRRDAQELAVELQKILREPERSVVK